MIHKQPGSFPRSDLLTDTGERRWDVSLLNITGEDEEPDAFFCPQKHQRCSDKEELGDNRARGSSLKHSLDVRPVSSATGPLASFTFSMKTS